MQPAKSDSRRRLNAGSSPQPVPEYIKVVQSVCETDGFINEQWVEPPLPRPVPWKTIIIILTLFCGGIVSV